MLVNIILLDVNITYVQLKRNFWTQSEQLNMFSTKKYAKSVQPTVTQFDLFFILLPHFLYHKVILLQLHYLIELYFEYSFMLDQEGVCLSAYNTCTDLSKPRVGLCHLLVRISVLLVTRLWQWWWLYLFLSCFAFCLPYSPYWKYFPWQYGLLSLRPIAKKPTI